MKLKMENKLEFWGSILIVICTLFLMIAAMIERQFTWIFIVYLLSFLMAMNILVKRLKK